MKKSGFILVYTLIILIIVSILTAVISTVIQNKKIIVNEFIKDQVQYLANYSGNIFSVKKEITITNDFGDIIKIQPQSYLSK